jgi:cytochrome c peroxidase
LWLTVVGPAVPQGQGGKPGSFSSCSSYTREGKPGCSQFNIPPEAQERSQRRLSERAERRRQMRERIEGGRVDTDLEQGLRKQIGDAGGSMGGSMGAGAFILPDSRELTKIPQDPLNPLSPEKVELGRLLFHETGLAVNPVVPSTKGSYSCASCHHTDAGFSAGLLQGLGEGGSGFGPKGGLRKPAANVDPASVDVQPVASPPVLNSAWQNCMLWNGQFGATGPNSETEYAWTEGTPKAVNRLGYEGIESQAIAGLAVHRLIDDSHPENTTASILSQNTRYAELFARAFPERPKESRVNQVTVGLAIAAYERTLISDRAPFQQWLRGNSTALTNSQKRGALVFFGEGKCVQCHSGPSLAGMQFHALGLKDLDTAPGAIIKDPKFQEVLGRGGFTGIEADMFTFKVPQLYNLKDHVAFGHGSSLRSVRAVLDYKNMAKPENSRVPAPALAAEFQPLGLSEAQLTDLTDFIENGLYDANLKRYLPAALPSGQCFPDNDPVARQDSNSYCPR